MNTKQQTTSSIELALLGYLHQRPMHGYEIHQLLGDSDGLDGLWQVKLSRLYAMLGRLEAHDYVLAESQAQGDRPPRKVYCLTPTGEATFLSWVTSPVEQPRDLRLEFMLKLYFARKESIEEARKLVTRQLQVCDDWLESRLVATTPNDSFQSMAVHQFRRGQIEAIRNWLIWLGNELEAMDS